MKIWVDADACPREVRAVLQRASQRLQIPMVLVANRDLGVPATKLMHTRIVPQRADEADKLIAAECEAGDIVITADVPLAADVVEKGAHAIDPRGDEYTADDVRSRLSMRNFMEGLRSAGQIRGGPPEYSNVEKQRFAAALDRLLTRCMKGKA